MDARLLSLAHGSDNDSSNIEISNALPHACISDFVCSFECMCNYLQNIVFILSTPFLGARFLPQQVKFFLFTESKILKEDWKIVSDCSISAMHGKSIVKECISPHLYLLTCLIHEKMIPLRMMCC